MDRLAPIEREVGAVDVTGPGVEYENDAGRLDIKVETSAGRVRIQVDGEDVDIEGPGFDIEQRGEDLEVVQYPRSAGRRVRVPPAEYVVCFH